MKLERERIHNAYLLPSIVLLLVLQPLLATLSSTPTAVLMLPFVVTLVAVIWSLDLGGAWSRRGVAVGAVALAANLARMKSSTPHLEIVAGSASALLSLLCVVLGVRALFAAAQTTATSLLTAVSVYLLIGITFAIVYSLVFAVEPGWFKGVSPGRLSAEISELLYFSLGTLSTVAYGDILPVHPISRLLCNVEAIVGQMYVAVLVALLVGGYAAGRASTTRGGPHGD